MVICMINVIDITVGIHEGMTTYPGVNKYADFPILEYLITPETDAPGKNKYSGKVTMHNHCGTHIDTPKHFGMKSDLSDIDVNVVCGPAVVIKMMDLKTGGVTPEMLEEKLPKGVETKGKRLIVVCGYLDDNWNKPGYFENAPFFTPEAAQWVIDKGFVLLALDMQTDDFRVSPTHRTLLSAGVYILEYISNVYAIPDKPEVFLITAPLKLEHMEASSTRAYIIDGIIS